MKVLGVITAKSQSTRVKDKNLKPLMGKPLYKWTVDYLVKQKSLLDTVVFSSDDPSKFLIPPRVKIVTRPIALCEDNIPHVLSVKHAMMNVEHEYNIEYDYCILFQPTNPFRSSQELHTMIASLEKYRPDVGKTYYVDDNLKEDYIIEAQFHKEIDSDSDGILIRSGSMYAYSRQYLMGMHAHGLVPSSVYVLVPKRRGYNINNDDDFIIVESLMKAYKCELK